MRIDLNIAGDRLKPERDTSVAACPRCNVFFKFRSGLMPEIDSCGFESYSFKCRECGAHIAGIVDPADDALLLSVANECEQSTPLAAARDHSAPC